MQREDQSGNLHYCYPVLSNGVYDLDSNKPLQGEHFKLGSSFRKLVQLRDDAGDSGSYFGDHYFNVAVASPYGLDFTQGEAKCCREKVDTRIFLGHHSLLLHQIWRLSVCPLSKVTNTTSLQEAFGTVPTLRYLLLDLS